MGYEIVNLFLAFVAVVIAAIFLRIGFHRTRDSLMRGLRRFIVSFVSCVICLVIFDVILEANPSLQLSFVNRLALWPSGIPGTIEDEKFGYVGEPDLVTESYYDPDRDGDLISWVRPERREKTGEEGVPQQIKLDSNGFQNAAVPEKVDMLIVGDSFAVESWLTEGKQKQWMSAVREGLGCSAYNIAVPGYGTSQEYMTLAKYGFDKHPRIVLWAFYEGNDIHDVAAFQEFKMLQSEKGLTWLDYVTYKKPELPPRRFPYNRPLVRLLLHFAQSGCSPDEPYAKDTVGFNPASLTAGGKTKPHALQHLDFYQMLLSRERLARWNEWQITMEIIKQAIGECNSRGIKFVLVFFPDKGHVYFPLIDKQVDHELFCNFLYPWLEEEYKKAPEEMFRQMRSNKSNISHQMRDVCEDNSAIFIDVTEALTEAAMRGEFPYWCYDTHLNPKGHQIVAQIILDRLRKDGLAPEE